MAFTLIPLISLIQYVRKAYECFFSSFPCTVEYFIKIWTDICSI